MRLCALQFRCALAAALVISGSCYATASAAAEHKDDVQIDAQFPGGNIVVDKIEGNHVWVRPDLRDTRGKWFYWNFRVRGAAGRTVVFTFNGDNVIGVRGPAVSRDEGRTWSWLGAAAVHGKSFTYAFPADAHSVRFCFAIPYTSADWQSFLQRHTSNPAVRIATLCRTANNRDVPLLYVGCLDGPPAVRVLLTARHHACESLASYVLEGLLDAVLASDADGAWLRKHVEFLVVPFVDLDGVEDGDQGKNRIPHDHNRDYLEKRYASVRALTKLAPAWSQGKLRVALDLHCPWIRGPHNEVIYFVGGRDTAIWRETVRLSELLEAARRGPLPFHASDNLPFGQAWNKGAEAPNLRKCEEWAATLPGIRLAGAMEIPYANASNHAVTADAARAFGADLAHALRRYLEHP